MRPGKARTFQTEGGVAVPAATAEQMQEVDRIAVGESGLGTLAKTGLREVPRQIGPSFGPLFEREYWIHLVAR